MNQKHTKATANKIRVGTLLMFLLTLLVTFGGWIFTKQLLKYKETQLLAKSGQLRVADSGYSLQQEDTQKTEERTETDEPEIFQGEPVSETIMAQILNCWESGSSLLSHDPQQGQMNMEQAINAGIQWIREMSQKGCLPFDPSENHFRDVSAILYTTEEIPTIPVHLLSRWNITYTIDGIRLILTIHAASGQVWNADIYTQSDLTCPDDELLLKTAFPFLTKGGTELSESIETGTYNIRVISPEGKIAASVIRCLISQNINSENEQTTFAVLTLKLSSRK